VAGTRVLIGELLARRREYLNELFDRTLAVIRDAFRARKIFVVRDVVVEGRPDHYARLEMVKVFIELMRLHAEATGRN
jgi:hypothetical protein